MKCGYLSILLAALFLGTKAQADVWLSTFNLDAPTEDGQSYDILAYERFISYVDCRDRGVKNVELMRTVGARGGFVCIVADAP